MVALQFSGLTQNSKLKTHDSSNLTSEIAEQLYWEFRERVNETGMLLGLSAILRLENSEITSDPLL